MPSVEEQIAARLLADPAVSAVLGGRVYPDDLPPQPPPGPRAEIDLTAEDPPDTLDGSGGGTFAVTVTVYGQRKTTARLARDRVRGSLDGYRGGPVRYCQWDGSAAVGVEAGFGYSISFVGRYDDTPAAPPRAFSVSFSTSFG